MVGNFASLLLHGTFADTYPVADAAGLCPFTSYQPMTFRDILQVVVCRQPGIILPISWSSNSVLTAEPFMLYVRCTIALPNNVYTVY